MELEIEFLTIYKKNIKTNTESDICHIWDSIIRLLLLY